MWKWTKEPLEIKGINENSVTIDHWYISNEKGVRIDFAENRENGLTITHTHADLSINLYLSLFVDNQVSVDANTIKIHIRFKENPILTRDYLENIKANIPSALEAYCSRYHINKVIKNMKLVFVEF